MSNPAIITPEDAQTLAKYITGLARPIIIRWKRSGFQVAQDERRTLSQNALLHVWFADIAKHFGDRTEKQVKGECHRDLGLSIRLAGVRDEDAQFTYVWERTGAKMNPEKQAGLLASEVLTLSSSMSTPQLREYMNKIEAEYLPMGVALTNPEDRG